MNIVKKILNLFGVLLALVFSILLTVVLIAAPVVSVTKTVMTPKTIQKVMKNIDYQEVLLSNEEVAETLEEHGLDAQTVEAIVDSNAVGEVVDLYIEDVFAAMDGELTESSLTPEAIKAIAYENMDEIIEVVKNYADPADTITTEEIQTQITQVVEEYADEVVTLLPPIERLGLAEKEIMSEETVWVLDTVKELRTGKITLFLLAIAAVLSLLILLCRFKRFKGFMWLGVIYLLTALIPFGVSFVAGGSQVVQMLQLEGWMANLVGSAVTVLSQTFLLRSFILFGIAVLCIAVFVLGRKGFFKNKRKAKETEG